MPRREFYSDYRESGMAFDKYKKSTSQPYPNPRVHREDPETEAIHERAARVLGWSLKDVRSHSMPSLREVVRGTGSDPQLVRAMDLWIRSGQGIIPKRKVGSQRIPGRVPQWMLDDQAKYAAEDAAAKAHGLTLQKLPDGTVGYRKNPRPHTYHLPASNFRAGDIGTLESDVGVGFDAQDGQFRTRRRAMVKGKVRSAPAAHLPAGRYVVEAPAYMRGHATVKRVKNPPTQADIRALRDALVANGVEARLTKTGITVSLSHGGKRTARIVPAGYVGASFAILFSNGERGELRTDGRWSPRDAARSVLDALMSRSMQESQRLHGEHVRTQNPKPRSTRDKAILLHRWMDRQEAREGAYDARHAYKHKAGTPEHAAYIAESGRKRRVAHAARLKVAALNQELGQGMSETTRMVRGMGHSVAEHLYHNPRRISNKRPATMSAKAINAELDALEAEGTRLMHEAIATGRGHERPSDRVHMTDPLSMAVKAVDNRMWELRREVEQRYGRWTPRLPETRMFGAREKA
jgi:hypothetical protein